MALFHAAIKRDSVSSLSFLSLSHDQVFSCVISLVCRLKYPYSCFFSHFCFQVFVIVSYAISTIISCHNLSFFGFLMYSSNPCIDASMQSSLMSSLLPSIFLNSYNLSISFLGFKNLGLVINFLVLWFICLSSPLLNFKNSPEYFSSRTAQVFIPLMRFLPQSLVSGSFLARLRYSFLI